MKLHISICLIFFWCISCGYRFEQGNFPGGIKSLSITILENRTSQVGLEMILTNHLIDEFTRRSGIILTPEIRADAVLTGEIESLKTETVSRRESQIALEREVHIAIALKLTARDGQVLWYAKGISASQAYPVDSDKMTTEQQRGNAIIIISKQIAEDVYHCLIAGM